MKRSFVGIGLLVFQFFSLIVAFTWVNPAGAADLTVTNTNDSGPGSLRQAIAAAQPNDTITFAPEVSGTILLTSGELVISKSVIIAGPSADSLTISGNNASRVITITSSVNVTISGLTIANGYTPDNGGGIYNSGFLTLTNDVVNNNAAGHIDFLFYRYGYGGGLFSFGTVVLTGSEIHDNVGYAGGGGIESIGVLTVTNSQLYNNAGQFGGGLFSVRGAATLIDSMLYSNTATLGIGGGLTNAGTMSMTNDLIFGNAADSTGGGVTNYGFLTASASSFYDNISSYGGSGLYNQGTLTLLTSAVYRNTSPKVGGGILNDGTLTLTDSAVYGNTALQGGGLYSQGWLNVTKSAIYSNTASKEGGGLYVRLDYVPEDVNITNTTISGNNASSGGGLYASVTLTPTPNTLALNNVTLANNQAGGIATTSDVTTTIRNSIVANNLGLNCNRALVSAGYNLESGNSCGLGAPGDLANTDPRLSPLADNGGLATISGHAAPTHALLPGSPAIDAGNPAAPGTGGNACAATDQRGLARPQGLHCDIGAYEAVLAADLTIEKTATAVVVAPGQTLTYTLVFRNIGLMTAAEVLITDVVPVAFTHPSFAGSVTITPTGAITYAWQVGDLAPFAGGVIVLTGVVSPALMSDTTFTNTAIITTKSPEIDAASNASTVNTTVHIPRVMFSLSDPATVLKNAGVVTVPVVLDLASPFTVSVSYATHDGTAMAGQDYLAATGTLTFAPGVTTQTFPVTILNNPGNTGGRFLILTLHDPAEALIGAKNPVTMIISAALFKVRLPIILK